MPHRVAPVTRGVREALVAFFEGGDPRFGELALDGLAATAAARPAEARLGLLLGTALSETVGREAEAESACRAAVAADPGYAAAHRAPHDSLGVALALSGKAAEAEAAFERAADLATPDGAAAGGRASLGSALMRRGRMAEAVSAYRAALVERAVRRLVRVPPPTTAGPARNPALTD
jgi:Flp pilus assembly protein TadD